MKLTDSEKFLTHEKTFLTLLYIYQKEVTYISEVSANIDSTFSHTNKIIKQLEELGYISSVFEGRTRFLQLTPRGYYYAGQLKDALDICRSGEIFEFPQGYVPVRKEEKEEKNESIEPEAFRPVSSAHFGKDPETGGIEKTRPAETNTIAGRIQLFCHRISEIYDELAKEEAEAETLLQKLGPYDRELKMIGRELEKLEPSDSSTFVLMTAYRAAEMQYRFYLGKD